MKICIRCNINKPDEDFRIKSSLSRDKTKRYYFLNCTCKACDTELAKEYYHKHKNEEQFKHKNRNNVKRYRRENWEIVKEKDKVRRQRPQSKKNRKIYYENNREKILKDHRVICNKYQKRLRDTIDNKYMASLLVNGSNISISEINNHPELIQLFKAYYLLKKQIKNGKSEKTN